MDVKGQKGRVAGHIIDNIFYVVFLDREHRFYITEKRHTILIEYYTIFEPPDSGASGFYNS